MQERKGTAGGWSVGGSTFPVVITETGTFVCQPPNPKDAARIARVPEMESRIAVLEAALRRIATDAATLQDNGGLWAANVARAALGVGK